MDGDLHRCRESDGAEIDVVNVHDIPLDAVIWLDNSALANASRRAADKAENDGESYAAHGSSPVA